MTKDEYRIDIDLSGMPFFTVRGQMISDMGSSIHPETFIESGMLKKKA